MLRNGKEGAEEAAAAAAGAERFGESGSREDTAQRSTASNAFVLGWPCGCSPPFINGVGGDGQTGVMEVLAKVFLCFFPRLISPLEILPSG